ncbi:hypothetical protein EB796_001706 [Bugula neritina]|uniref:Uncharacterized protein n=1 Tax=Bugula neritina TaxID=10212 RepID=A0A7J7KJ07_BUGNE|nr:hypothetical protein EB796_002989 [Bugula neritina]KAF6040019.1 hypothetical protein EB796_001706 [Bugula neritina]
MDICIAISKVVVDLHDNQIVSNDISHYNFLLRLEGQGWVPYLADTSSAERLVNNTLPYGEKKCRGVQEKHKLTESR